MLVLWCSTFRTPSDSAKELTFLHSLDVGSHHPPFTVACLHFKKVNQCKKKKINKKKEQQHTKKTLSCCLGSFFFFFSVISTCTGPWNSNLPITQSMAVMSDQETWWLLAPSVDLWVPFLIIITNYNYLFWPNVCSHVVQHLLKVKKNPPWFLVLGYLDTKDNINYTINHYTQNHKSMHVK